MEFFHCKVAVPNFNETSTPSQMFCNFFANSSYFKDKLSNEISAFDEKLMIEYISNLRILCYKYLQEHRILAWSWRCEKKR